MRAGILFLLLASTTFSTVPATPQGPAVDGAVHTQIEGIAIPTIANAPFTAKIVVAWDEPLSGGGTLSRTYYTMVARDNKGRVRREARGFLPTGSTEKPPLRSFQINDPTSNKQITCRAATKRCAVTDYHPRAALNQPERSQSPTSATRTRAVATWRAARRMRTSNSCARSSSASSK